MDATTIKVTRELRDRLKLQASVAHRTLGEHLRHLADLDDRARRFETLRAAIDATPAEAKESYRAEVAAWDRLDHG